MCSGCIWLPSSLHELNLNTFAGGVCSVFRAHGYMFSLVGKKVVFVLTALHLISVPRHVESWNCRINFHASAGLLLQ